MPGVRPSLLEPVDLMDGSDAVIVTNGVRQPLQEQNAIAFPGAVATGTVVEAEASTFCR